MKYDLLTLAFLCLHVHRDYTSVTPHERLNATKSQARGIPLPDPIFQSVVGSGMEIGLILRSGKISM
jgi:hypothetical protein